MRTPAQTIPSIWGGAAGLSLDPSEGLFLGLVGRDKELRIVPDWGSIFERGLCWHPQRQSTVYFPE